MTETDRQTDKSAKTTRWAFTAFEGQWNLFTTMPTCVAEWGWQQEISETTGRPHYQGYLRTKQQVRFSQISKDLPGVHIEPAKNWSALINYCNKTETAVEGTQVKQVSQNHNVYTLAPIIAAALPPLEVIKDDYEELRIKIRKEACGEEPNYKLYNCHSWEEYFKYRIDVEVKIRIRNGETNLVWVASNPQWKCMWASYGEDFLVGIKSQTTV